MKRSVTEIALEKYAEELAKELETLRAKYNALTLIDSFYYTKLLKNKLDISEIKAQHGEAVAVIETQLDSNNYCENPELVKRHVHNHFYGLFEYLEMGD